MVLFANVSGADIPDPRFPGLVGAQVVEPQEIFRQAAAGSGVGHADSPTGSLVRRHWPFYAPNEGKFHSLGWAAAAAFGARLDPAADQQWLRYYGENGPWESLSYYVALDKAPGYFSNKVVFVGGWPKDTDPGSPEDDKFLTPYSDWTGQASGGMAIMATTFLNLVNGDWLRRLPAAIEVLVLVLSGILFGAGLSLLRPLPAGLVAVVAAVAVTLLFVSWSYFTNYWFPWLIIAGGQVPCALAWCCVFRPRPIVVFSERYPGYTPVSEPFGEGTYGKVRLVHDAMGNLQALKEIERAKFQDDSPYEREFHGIKNYKPLSNQHTGLLHIDHVNRNDVEGYFYYVMELGDPLDPDWQARGGTYQPRDLGSACRNSESGRLPARECIRIGIALLEPLVFLHEHGLVHRDIKPSNIIFVNGQPKLADVGLVRQASQTDQEATWVGTEFQPCRPSRPAHARRGPCLRDGHGAPYHVISTGKHPRLFSELPTTLVGQLDFMRLNQIICQACQPEIRERYATAADMLAALRAAQNEIAGATTKEL